MKTPQQAFVEWIEQAQATLPYVRNYLRNRDVKHVLLGYVYGSILTAIIFKTFS